jgi:hypothetical protein
LAADRWLLVTEALPTHQKFILIRVSGEEKFLMRWPYKITLAPIFSCEIILKKPR